MRNVDEVGKKWEYLRDDFYFITQTSDGKSHWQERPRDSATITKQRWSIRFCLFFSFAKLKNIPMKIELDPVGFGILYVLLCGRLGDETEFFFCCVTLFFPKLRCSINLDKFTIFPWFMKIKLINKKYYEISW